MKTKAQVQKLIKGFILATQNKKKEDQEKTFKSLIEFLKEKRKFKLLFQFLSGLKKELKNREVVLSFASKESQEMENKVRKSLKDFFKEDSVFTTETDESLIAGFRAKTNNFLIDASIRGILEKTRNKIL